MRGAKEKGAAATQDPRPLFYLRDQSKVPGHPRLKTIGMAIIYQPPYNCLNSKVGLNKGPRFTIAATGEVSVSNYGLTTGPDGSRQYSSNRAWGGFPILPLVGKIGKPF